MKNVLRSTLIWLTASSLLYVSACNDDESEESQNVAPTIANQTFSVSEDVPVGTHIGTINASDANDDPLSFQVTSGNEGNQFIVTSDSGHIRLNALLDFEVKSSYELNILVSDGELADSAIVTISVTDVNENEAPLIEDQTFTLPENTLSETEIGSIIAQDPEGDDLTFSLISGNTGDIFSLSNDGTLFLESSVGLDYEVLSTYTLIVGVSDGQESAQADITISVTDTEEQMLQIGGYTYEMKEGLVSYFGSESFFEEDSHENYFFTITDGQFAYDNEFEIYFEELWSTRIVADLYSPGLDGLVPGTYNFLDIDNIIEDDVNGQAIFFDAAIMSDDNFWFVMGGTVEVQVTNDEQLTLIFEVTVEDFNEVESEMAFTFTSTFKTEDVSEEEEAAGRKTALKMK